METNKSDFTDNPIYDVDIDYDELQDWGTANRRICDVGAGVGIASQHMTNAFMGFNHRMTALPLPKNREQTYLTFFTRPNMNLSRQNMQVSRRLDDKARSNVTSSNMALIAALDPLNEIVANDVNHIRLGSDLKQGIPFDNKQAFIPILSNSLISISGFPDNTVDVYTSPEGLRREQFSMVDSCYSINNSYSLSATFRNLDGDPITSLFSIWLEYMSGVYLGDMLPRAESIIENEIDYQTAIYRLNVDPSMRYVTKIGVARACFPMNDNLGAAMNAEMSNPMITDNDQINIQFSCIGAEYNDPILIEEFNRLVATFNPDMEPQGDVPDFIPVSPELMCLQPSEIQFFNYYAYPHISVRTREITWYVYTDTYNFIKKQVLGSAYEDNQPNG